MLASDLWTICCWAVQGRAELRFGRAEEAAGQGALGAFTPWHLPPRRVTPCYHPGLLLHVPVEPPWDVVASLSSSRRDSGAGPQPGLVGALAEWRGCSWTTLQGAAALRRLHEPGFLASRVTFAQGLDQRENWW